MRREVAAGAVVFHRASQTVLLLRHRQDRWAFPQGKSEGSESLSETMLRELYEETGIVPDSFQGPVESIEYVFGKGSLKTAKSVAFYVIVVDTRDVRISSEHKGFAWFPLSCASSLLPFDEQKRVFAKSCLLL